jgi:hypothetical protein
MLFSIILSEVCVVPGIIIIIIIIIIIMLSFLVKVRGWCTVH